jgi:hypothetical protein
VMLFEHPKVDNFWDNLIFSLVTKKKWEEERENKNTMRVWERESCPLFYYTNIIIEYIQMSFKFYV